jgi:menaquinone reductase, multiheme cytochrome c subunit
MARFLFPEWTETFKKWLLLLVLGGPVYLVALLAYGVTPEAIRLGYQPQQPVPYDHAVHVGELGMDCRYCHDTVEKSSHAAVPPAETCMNCHESIHPDSDRLLPIRESYASGAPVEWVRVHNLPDYVYFDHSAHVTRGVGCESCHGRVDQMDVVYQAESLNMEWCLDCHRDPDAARRPPSKITEMGYEFPDEPISGPPLTREARLEAGINPPVNPLTDCSTCHR